MHFTADNFVNIEIGQVNIDGSRSGRDLPLLIPVRAAEDCQV